MLVGDVSLPELPPLPELTDVAWLADAEVELPDAVDCCSCCCCCCFVNFVHHCFSDCLVAACCDAAVGESTGSSDAGGSGVSREASLDGAFDG